MKSGIELIAAERQEQIEKHGRTIERDVEQNNIGQLLEGAHTMMQEDPFFFTDNSNDLCPPGWDYNIFKKMITKPYKERLVIAGALIAAEIDRLQNGND